MGSRAEAQRRASAAAAAPPEHSRPLSTVGRWAAGGLGVLGAGCWALGAGLLGQRARGEGERRASKRLAHLRRTGVREGAESAGGAGGAGRTGDESLAKTNHRLDPLRPFLPCVLQSSFTSLVLPWSFLGPSLTAPGCSPSPGLHLTR